MKLPLLFIFLLIFELAFSQDAIQTPSLSYPETIFNADTCCWRKLSAAGCDEEAAQLILI